MQAGRSTSRNPEHALCAKVEKKKPIIAPATSALVSAAAKPSNQDAQATARKLACSAQTPNIEPASLMHAGKSPKPPGPTQHLGRENAFSSNPASGAGPFVLLRSPARAEPNCQQWRRPAQLPPVAAVICAEKNAVRSSPQRPQTSTAPAPTKPTYKGHKQL